MKYIIMSSHQNDDYKEVSKIKDTYGGSPVNSGSNVNNDQLEVDKPHNSAGTPTQDPKRGLWKKWLSEITENLVWGVLEDLFSRAFQALARIAWERAASIILGWCLIQIAYPWLITLLSRWLIQPILEWLIQFVWAWLVQLVFSSVITLRNWWLIQPVLEWLIQFIWAWLVQFVFSWLITLPYWWLIQLLLGWLVQFVLPWLITFPYWWLIQFIFKRVVQFVLERLMRILWEWLLRPIRNGSRGAGLPYKDGRRIIKPSLQDR